MSMEYGMEYGTGDAAVITVGEPARGEIHRLLGELSASQEHLAQAIDELHSRLMQGGVLRERSEKPMAVESAPNTQTQIGAHLNEMVGRMNAHRSMLTDILDRLEV